jgi:probable phosphoglycerate mutase
MATTRFIVVRHGETAWNVEGRYQGHRDSPLTGQGNEQARALANRLVRHTFTVLYSSDLGRAARTAQIIAEATGHSVRVDARLRERNLGILQGLTEGDAPAQFPKEFKRFKVGGPDYVIPEGESMRQRYACVVDCFEDLANRHGGEQVVVVAHGGVLSSLFRRTVGIALEVPRHFRFANASWNVFARIEGRWWLETWGDVSHLPPNLVSWSD